MVVQLVHNGGMNGDRLTKTGILGLLVLSVVAMGGAVVTLQPNFIDMAGGVLQDADSVETNTIYDPEDGSLAVTDGSGTTIAQFLSDGNVSILDGNLQMNGGFIHADYQASTESVSSVGLKMGVAGGSASKDSNRILFDMGDSTGYTPPYLEGFEGDIEMEQGNFEIVDGNLGMKGNNIREVGGLRGQCPSGYVWVPGSSKYGTQPGFCVMKYEAKDDGGDPVSQASGDPWVNIEQYTARNECGSLDDGYHLITEAEWMTMAEQAAQNPSNWADDTVGSKIGNNGGLFSGNNGNSNSVSCNIANPADGTDSCSGKRTMVLDNGNTVWDLSGNVREWTDAYLIERDTAGTGGGDDNDGVTDEMVDAGGVTNRNWFEFTEVTDYGNAPQMRPVDTEWGADNGIGRIYINPGEAYDGSSYASKYHAVLRGGGWDYGRDAGVFTVILSNAPPRTNSRFGFRCSYSPVR